MAHPRAALASSWWAVMLVLLLGCVMALIDATPALSKVAAARASKRSPSEDGGSRYHFNRVEKCFLRKINRRRFRNGLRLLRWDRHVGFVARLHARKMARTAVVVHDAGVGHKITHWRALGQNSGAGGSCRGLIRRFWASPAHRANILGRWRFMGVGTRWRNGYLYVQQIFEFRSNPGNVYGYP
jgi:uncharacterized protein YkwD